MYTYQDFMAESRHGLSEAIKHAINEHKASSLYRVALDADQYDAQRNSTICNYTKQLYTLDGQKRIDTMSSNNRLCSNFFRHLNTQRNTYSLGNGVTFNDEGIKERLGADFDTKLSSAGYFALIHGVSFLFWAVDHVHVFKVTEFVPLWDEETGALMAGIRFWQIDSNKPLMVVLYEVDGFTKFRADNTAGDLVAIVEKHGYIMHTVQTPVDDEPEIVGEENYSSLPIVPLYGSRLQQSTLVGMKAQIDAYDLIRSGFANDLTDCAEIYWMVSGAGGMTDSELARFRDRLRLTHIATADDDVNISTHTAEIPTNARKIFLDDIRAGIYEDFGGLDVHTVAAGATNDHIQAAYQPLDDVADDYEYQIIDAVQHLLALIGLEDTPTFKRNRISNQQETTAMILNAASYLDDETVLNKLPFITPDEVADILSRRDMQDMERFNAPAQEDPEHLEEVTTNEVDA